MDLLLFVTSCYIFLIFFINRNANRLHRRCILLYKWGILFHEVNITCDDNGLFLHWISHVIFIMVVLQEHSVPSRCVKLLPHSKALFLYEVLELRIVDPWHQEALSRQHQAAKMSDVWLASVKWPSILSINCHTVQPSRQVFWSLPETEQSSVGCWIRLHWRTFLYNDLCLLRYLTGKHLLLFGMISLKDLFGCYQNP